MKRLWYQFAAFMLYFFAWLSYFLVCQWVFAVLTFTFFDYSFSFDFLNLFCFIIFHLSMSEQNSETPHFILKGLTTGNRYIYNHYYSFNA